MPQSVIIIERNGGFGNPIISRLTKSSIKRNLYYEIKEKVIEESFNGYRFGKEKRLVKVYGTDSTKDVRNRMIDILFDRIAYHKDKFIAPLLHSELTTMVMKPNGKIEHNNDAHDDQVFSYLHALRPLYDNAAFLSREFGIRKFSIKTDEDEEVIDGDLEQLEKNGYELIDLDSAEVEENSEYSRMQEYIKDASRYKTASEFDKVRYEIDEQQTQAMLTNPVARAAYEKKYNTTVEDPARSTVRLPDSIFIQNDDGTYEDEEYGIYGSADKGNLNDIFTNV
jgi:hypothetical protein